MKTNLLAGLGAAAALASCAGIPNEDFSRSPTRADEHRISVAETGDRLDIAVSDADMALTPETRANIDRFARSYLRVGHGPLILSAPSGGANADAASRLAHETRMRLAESGVPYSAIAGSAYDASAAPSAPIVLSFTRYEATAPDCAPLWRQDLAHQYNNQTYESFGCAGQANLAAMIEDPHDLLSPREESARDGARRATVMTNYRAGNPTSATRTPDERVTISNAVQ